VLDGVRAARAAGRTPVVVVDIDDTILRWKKVNGQKVSASPMPGAAGYLHALEKAGARIVYLTGRPEEARGETRKVLRALGVPRGDRHRLLMNRLPPDRPVVESKAEARREILELGTPVAFFDNDLANVRLFRRQYPGAQVVRVAGHSSSADPEPQRGLDEVAVVVDFSAHKSGIVRRLTGRVRWHLLAGNRHATVQPKRGRAYRTRPIRALRGARITR
jgi:ribonucleotide monophosphatase NagD (HAD superfamily)